MKANLPWKSLKGSHEMTILSVNTFIFKKEIDAMEFSLSNFEVGTL